MTAFPIISPAQKKPPILEVIGARIELRRHGKEHVGLCLFHNDHHPSLFVNPEKQVFLCRSCQARGDVFDFVQLAEGCSFREALAILGIAPGRRPENRPTAVGHSDSAGWAKEQREKLNHKIRDIDEQMELADELDDTELAESFWRERRIVAQIRNDLSCRDYRADFVEIKDTIEIIAGKIQEYCVEKTEAAGETSPAASRVVDIAQGTRRERNQTK